MRTCRSAGRCEGKQRVSDGRERKEERGNELTVRLELLASPVTRCETDRGPLQMVGRGCLAEPSRAWRELAAACTPSRCISSH